MVYSDTLLIILGWLLGLLSPVIVTAIQSEREVKTLKKTIFVELEELRYRLVLVIYKIESKHGEIDKSFFQWAQSIILSYKGINASKSFLEAVNKVSNFTEEQIINYVSQTRALETASGSGLELKKQIFSLQDSDLNTISKFEVVLQNQLLDIKTRIGYLNEIVDDAKYYFRLSFQQDISDGNYKIANTNMINSYKSFSTQAKMVADLISDILAGKSRNV
jgi:hypothetical protein